MADGVMPSNEGRGYVLRRILRRAARHAHIMGCTDALLHRLVSELVAEMGTAYPELNRAEVLITETLKLEEERFRATLARGLKLLEEETSKLATAAPLPGEVAFRLYDTFGFPLDLTQDALRVQGHRVDLTGFEKSMEKQRAAARAAWVGSGDVATDEVWFGLRERLGATEFLGYQAEMAEGVICAILVDGVETESILAGTEAVIVVNQTPFYGESGGQMGDQGVVFTQEGAEFTVKDTQKKLGDLHLHAGTLEKGTLNIGNISVLRVDGAHRARLRANHSATHLLHEALRRRLGDHVTQKGSLVAVDRLRFDISHPKALDSEELRDAEAAVNSKIRANAEVRTRIMTPEEAVAAGAMALFGEKYGDEVRVVAMGGEEGSGDKDGVNEGGGYSVELCGGTHVRRAGDIGTFRIVSETALAAGVRRIEALTGADADDYVNRNTALLSESAGLFKSAAEDVPARIAQILDERRQFERELSELRRQVALGNGQGWSVPEEKNDVAGVKLMTRSIQGVPAKDLKPMVDDYKAQGSGVYVVMSASEDGKASIVIGVTDDLTDRFDAVTLVRAGAEALGGKGGGGRPDMAQAGGPDASASKAAFAAVAKAMEDGEG